MVNHSYEYTEIGGDLRQVFLARELALTHGKVRHYALCCEPDPEKIFSPDQLIASPSFEEAIMHSGVVIFPIPFFKPKTASDRSYPDLPDSPEEILEYFHSGQFLFAGCLSPSVRELAQQKGVFWFDLMEHPSFRIYNSIATAEGALCEAIIRSNINLHKSRCAVLGYGACGQTIASYLKGMFSQTFVYTDEETELARAKILADQAQELSAFPTDASSFDFIFNTIPALILDRTILKKLNPLVTILDIASAPGGVDYDSAKEFSLSAYLCPGLPGIYAPLSSARAIAGTIHQALEQSTFKLIRSVPSCH